MKILIKISIIFFLSVGLIYLKSRVVALEKSIMLTNQEIIAAREEKGILQAEYAYLARPERIHDLATARLQLKAPVSSQIRVYSGDDDASV